MDIYTSNPKDFEDATEESLTSSFLDNRPHFGYNAAKKFEDLALSTHVMFSIVGIIVGFTNIVIITSVFKYKNLRSSTNVFLVSMAFADLMNCPALFLIRIHNYIDSVKYNEINMKIVNNIALVLGVSSVIMSAISFLLIAIERWIAVTFPLKFKAIVSIKKSVTVAICSWVYGFTVCCVILTYYTWEKPLSFFQKPYTLATYMPWPVFRYLGPFHYGFCICSSIVIYISIAIQMKRRNSAFQNKASANLQQSTKKVTQMTFTVLVLFVIIWIPLTFLPVVKLDIFYGSFAGRVAHTVMILLMNSNSFMNIFVYAWKSEPFRTAFADMLCVKCKTKPPSSNAAEVGSSKCVTSQTSVKQQGEGMIKTDCSEQATA